MSMTTDTVRRHTWTLRMHPGDLVFARLDPGSDLPEWARGVRPFSTVSWTPDETSVLAPVDVVPDDVDRFGPWRAFEVEGGVEFLLTGVLHGIIAPLAQSHLAVTTLSTYRTDWILVPADQAEAAVNVWRYAGFIVNVEGEASDDAEGARG
ncbi:MAG: ACT domain-containing protein [Propionibacteriaceae bacterium]|nr:ACT domain-containing protein [Propionibacteriaceae bacterium]